MNDRNDAGRVLRVLALVALAIGLAAITAATCVLSYGSIHALAADAGISQPLARLYPLIIDALLVLAGCSVLALRGSGIPSRIYAWLCLLVLLAGLAAGGAVHAAAITIPKRPAEIAAAILPFALVLVSFGLLLTLLRYARLRELDRRAAARSSAAVPPQDIVPPQDTVPPQNSVQPQPAEDRQSAEGSQSAAESAEISAAPGAPARAGREEPSMPLGGQQSRSAQVPKAGKTSPRLSRGGAPAGHDGGEAAASGSAVAASEDDEASDAGREAGALSASPTKQETRTGAQTHEAQPKTGTDAAGHPPAFDRPHSSPTPPAG